MLQENIEFFKRNNFEVGIWIGQTIGHGGDLAVPRVSKNGTPFKLEFAICPYPTRPDGENWKKLRFRAGKKYNNFNMMSSMKAMAYCGLPASRDDKLTQTQLSNISEGGVLTLYQIPFYITDFMPEFRYFEKNEER